MGTALAVHAVLSSAQTPREELDAAKAEFDFAKQRAEFLQKMIPDPTKYKVAEPKAPKLHGSYNRVTYRDAEAIAGKIVQTLESDFCRHRDLIRTTATARCCEAGSTRPILHTDESTVRSLLSASRWTRRTLKQLADRLDTVGGYLNDLVKPPIKDAPTDGRGLVEPINLGGAGGLLAAQVALSLATSLKSLYNFDSVSKREVIDGPLRALVLSKLGGLFTVLEPASIINTDSSELTDEEKAADNAMGSVRSLRIAIRSAREAAKALKEKEGFAQDKPAQARVAELEAAIKRATEAADEADKGIAGIHAVDATGFTPLDNAIRGGLLAKRLERADVYSLSVVTVASDMDMIAEDGLLRSLRISISSGTIVRWQLSRSNGDVVSVGSKFAGQAREPIQLRPPE